jgi:hypothetical protein
VLAAVIRTENLSFRSPLVFKLAGGIALAWLLFMLIMMLEIKFPFSLLIYFGAWKVISTVSNWRSGSQGDHQRYLKRVTDGDAAGVIDELTGRENLSAPQLVALSVAHTWLGDGEQGEAFARRALDLHPIPAAPPSSAKLGAVDNMPIVALADALAIQGRYAEAIDLSRRLEDDSDMPAMWAINNAVWALCAGDEALSRQFVSSVSSVSTRLGLKNSVTSKYQLMYFYLQHRLLGIEHHDDMRGMAAALAEWEDEAARTAHAPHGQCLNEILSDIRAIVMQ